MSKRYYHKDQRILANCGTRREPDWIPGIVVEDHDDGSAWTTNPYVVELDEESDGKTRWCFGRYYLMQDTPQNRKRHNLEQAEEEKREYTYRPGRSEMGRSSVIITCPFCHGEIEAFVWSMAGIGKRCNCGAIHHWLSGTSRKRVFAAGNTF